MVQSVGNIDLRQARRLGECVDGIRALPEPCSKFWACLGNYSAVRPIGPSLGSAKVMVTWNQLYRSWELLEEARVQMVRNAVLLEQNNHLRKTAGFG